MERNREVRRGTMSGGGLSRRRRRQRNGEIGGGIETTRLRDRGVNKDRDHERLRQSKRQRIERMMHGGRDDEADESSEDVDDEYYDDDDDDDQTVTGVRHPPPLKQLPALSHNDHHQHNQRKKSLLLPLPWKPDDGVVIPKKARSGGRGGGEDQIQRQASMSSSQLSPSPAPAAQISPTSSNASIRIKTKPLGGTQPSPQPKTAAKSDDDMVMAAEALAVEALAKLGEGNLIEINQVYNHRHDNNIANGLSSEPRSRVSTSSNSFSPALVIQPVNAQHSNPSSNAPLTAVAPKRKWPRPVRFEDESSISKVPSLTQSTTLVSSGTKMAVDQLTRMEAARPKLDKPVSSSANQKGSASPESTVPHCVLQQEPNKQEGNPIKEVTVLEAKPNSREQEVAKEKVELSQKETTAPASDEATTTQFTPAPEIPGGKKFTIDLMADPEKSSPERDGLCDSISDDMSVAQEIQLVTGIDDKKKEADAGGKSLNQIVGESSIGGRKAGRSIIVEDFDSRKQVAIGETVNQKMKGIIIEDIDTRKQVARGKTVDRKMKPILIEDIDSMNSDNIVANGKPEPPKQQSKAALSGLELQADKIVPSSMSMPMTVAGWPSSFPPFGYMGQVPSLQAIIPASDATTASSSTHQNFPPPTVRRKSNSTHCFIAQSIQYHQRIMQMTPFWPASTGTPQIQGSFPGRSLGSLPNSNGTPIFAAFAGHPGTSTMNGNIIEAAKRAPIVFQQGPPRPGSANNMITGPALIFPINQHPAMVAAASAVRSGAGNPTPGAGTSLPTAGVSTSAVASSGGGGPAVAMNFGYSTDQYLSILQNNGYPFPIPANAGGPPSYRGGSPAQVMPIFTGPFYSPQMLHHSQLQLQHHQQHQKNEQQQQQIVLPAPASVPQKPAQLGHQNTSTSSGSSSSQKHKQQQKWVPGGGANGAGPSSHNLMPVGGVNGAGPSSPGLPSTKQHPQLHANLPRQLESEKGSEHKQSSVEMVLQAQKGLYANNLAIPIHRQNAALFSNTAAAAAELSSGVSYSEKQPTQQQQSIVKVDLTPCLSFDTTSESASPSGMDFSMNARSHTLFQNHPEVARHGYQMSMATASAAAASDSMQEKKAHAQSTDGGKAGSSLIYANNAANEERKMVALNPKTTGNSISQRSGFAKPDMEPRTRTFLGNKVVDVSSRAPNTNSASANSGRTSNQSTRATAGPTNASSVSPVSIPTFQQLQKQVQEQQMQQQYGLTRGKSSASSNNVGVNAASPTNTVSMPPASNPTFQQFQQLQRQAQEQQLHLHHSYGLTRAKKSTSSYSAGAYSERVPSGSTMTKFPQMLTSFPEGVIQGGSPSQPSQWKTSGRTTNPASSPSTDPLAAKSQHQQQGTPAPSSSHQNHISFGANAMKSAPTRAQHLPGSGTANAATSSTAAATAAVAIGSPSNSVSKSTSGTPRESASTKPTPAKTPSHLMQSHGKNSVSNLSHKSSPNGNVPSNLDQSQHIALSTYSSSSDPDSPRIRIAPTRAQHLPGSGTANAATSSTAAATAAVAIGSPSNSVSKSTSGTPRESASTKPTPAKTPSHLMQSHGKNSVSNLSHKSSPNGNVPSNLDQSQHIALSTYSSSSGKQLTQLPQYRSQPQPGMQKQPHLFFSNAVYMQAQAPQSSAATAAAAGDFNRRQAEHHQSSQQQQQQHQNQSSNPGSSGGLALAVGSSAASSSARAGAATANSTRMPPPDLLHASQSAASATQSTTSGGAARPLMSAMFPYMTSPPGMLAKPGDQKPSTGNDKSNGGWQSKKRS